MTIRTSIPRSIRAHLAPVLAVALVATTVLISTAVVTPDAQAQAGTITVNSSVDSLALSPNDGLCTLREAITAANSNTSSGATAGECAAGTSGTDTIVFSVPGPITLSGTELPSITTNVIIEGAGITVSGADSSRIVTVQGATVALNQITLTNGSTLGNGGALVVSASANMSMNNSTVQDSFAGGDGGGILVQFGSSLNLRSTSVQDNNGNSGGIAVLDASSSLRLDFSNVVRNTGTANGRAGGIYAEASVIINRGLIRGNIFTGNGGVAGALIKGSSETMAMTDTYMLDNRNTGSATTVSAIGAFSGARAMLERSGAMFNDGAFVLLGNVDLSNSTISTNTGIALTPFGDVTVQYSTITRNDSGGVFLSGLAEATVGASIIAESAGGADIETTGGLAGGVVSQGFNVIGEIELAVGSVAIRFDQQNDMSGVLDARLGPLANNSGPTPTHAPLTTSPAIDRVVTANFAQAVDGRGEPRTGTAGDAGAVETVGLIAVRCAGRILTHDLNINGGDGNGTSADDVMFGTSGADTIRGRGGNDTICGEAGNDKLLGEAGNDLIVGGAGEDNIWGGDGADQISGGSGTSRIRGGDGNDTINGSGSRDIILGEGGDDFIFSHGGRDTLQGGDGNDYLDGGDDTDVIRGGNGDDTLLTGNSGNDRLVGGRGDDQLNATNTTGSTRLTGGDDDDTIIGSAQLDRIWGDAGNDTINARGYNDLLRGGAGNDTIHGDDGRDTVEGGDGNDLLYGDAGNGDFIVGSGGNDLCDGGAGNFDIAHHTCESVTGVP